MGTQNSAISTQDPESINLSNYNLTSFPSNLAISDLTKHLYLAGNRLKNLPHHLKECLSVDLSNNRFGPDIPDDIAKALSTYSQLFRLYFSRNQLTKLNNHLTNQKIQALILSQNRFTYLPPSLSTNFESLSRLYLDANFLTELKNLSLTCLKVLSLSLNNIEFIDTSTIHLPNLTTLDLSKNKIKQIPNDFSKSFPALKELNLSDNFIKEFPVNDGSIPLTIEKLTIYNNEIDVIPGYFKLFNHLKELTIAYNNLRLVPELPESLQILRVNDNKINEITPQKLPQLQSLHLFYNQLEELPINMELPSLETLLLDHNKLTAFSINKSFSSTLSTLDISFNQISEIPSELFTQYTHLGIFNCTFNNISEIPSGISNCQLLYRLEISHNPIKRLPLLPTSLIIFHAVHCEIETVDNVFFNDTIKKEDAHIQNVCLSSNKLTHFPYIPSVVLLYLSLNNFSEIPQIGPNLKLLDVSFNKISSDIVIDNGGSLVDLDLSFNSINKFPTLSKCPLLNSLKLDNNPITETTADLSNLCLTTISLTNTSIQSLKIPAELLECLMSTKDARIEPVKKIHYINQLKDSGFSEITGLRSEMEDSIIVRDDLGLFAVCDGHAGNLTSIFCADNFSDLFEQMIRKNPNKVFTDVEIKDTMNSIHSQLINKLKNQKYDDGSTLCLAYIFYSNELNENNQNKRKLMTAHLGDARALILKNDGTARDLTVDHKPTMRSEFDRVHQEFGNLNNDRIDGTLAVARSIGDFSVYGVGRELELNIFDLTETDKYLIICCDGVFDVLSNDEVASIVQSAETPNEAAFQLRNSAYGIGSEDNISVIVVDINK